jgi:hypothetical protein
MFSPQAIAGDLPTSSTYAVSWTTAENPVWALLALNTSQWEKIFQYVKNSWSGTIAAKWVAQYDISEDNSANVESWAANNYWAWINIASMATLTYWWIQKSWYVSWLAALTAWQRVAAAAAWAVTSNAAPSANDLWTSVATDTTKAQLRGLL